MIIYLAIKTKGFLNDSEKAPLTPKDLNHSWYFSIHLTEEGVPLRTHSQKSLTFRRGVYLKLIIKPRDYGECVTEDGYYHLVKKDKPPKSTKLGTYNLIILPCQA